MPEDESSEVAGERPGRSVTGGAQPQDKGYGSSESRGYRPVMQQDEPTVGPPGPSGVSPAPGSAPSASTNGEPVGGEGDSSSG